MSRITTLEEYLEKFVDEHSEPAEDDCLLAITDEQVHSLGLFFIQGLAAFIYSLKAERELIDASHMGPDDFIN